MCSPEFPEEIGKCKERQVVVCTLEAGEARQENDDEEQLVQVHFHVHV